MKWQMLNRACKSFEKVSNLFKNPDYSCFLIHEMYEQIERAVLVTVEIQEKGNWLQQMGFFSLKRLFLIMKFVKVRYLLFFRGKVKISAFSYMIKVKTIIDLEIDVIIVPFLPFPIIRIKFMQFVRSQSKTKSLSVNRQATSFSFQKS